MTTARGGEAPIERALPPPGSTASHEDCPGSCSAVWTSSGAVAQAREAAQEQVPVDAVLVDQRAMRDETRRRV